MGKFNLSMEEYMIEETKDLEKAAEEKEQTKKKSNALVNASETPNNRVSDEEAGKDTPEAENAEEGALKAKTGTRPKKNEKKQAKALGRPKLDEVRKQYTITLHEKDYNDAMKIAKEDDISFAKVVERALKAYCEEYKTRAGKR